MVELIHYDVIVKVFRSLLCKCLTAKGLYGKKEVVDAFRLMIPDKQLAEVRILQYRTEGIEALL